MSLHSSLYSPGICSRFKMLYDFLDLLLAKYLAKYQNIHCGWDNMVFVHPMRTALESVNAVRIASISGRLREHCSSWHCSSTNIRINSSKQNMVDNRWLLRGSHWTANWEHECGWRRVMSSEWMYICIGMDRGGSDWNERQYKSLWHNISRNVSDVTIGWNVSKRTSQTNLEISVHDEWFKIVSQTSEGSSSSAMLKDGRWKCTLFLSMVVL